MKHPILLRLTTISRSPAFHYALLLTCIYLVVFLKLGSFPFRFWDESMFVVNACEMEKSGNYMVPFFDHAVDWRNSKPLLFTWIQVGFIKIFGFNELAMRLPSALAVAGSVLMLFHFLRKRMGLLFAWTAALILLTSQGYITYHTGRTGDADALLSFLLLATCICYLKWLPDTNWKFLGLSLFFFGLAVMTKSFAAFLIVPALLGFALFYLKTRFLQVFSSGYFYLGFAFVLLSLFVVFPLRELYQPGFLTYTFSHDAGRLGTIIELHDHGWDFYLESIFYHRYSTWTLAFLLGGILIFTVKEKPLRTVGLFSLVFSLGYLVLISVSTTKLVWYDMPLYPFMAIISAVPVYLLLNQFFAAKSVFMTVAVIFVLFFIPYRRQFFAAQNNAFAPGDQKEELTSLFLFDQLKTGHANDLTVYHHGYQGSLLCYKYRYADLGYTLRITYTPDFKTGELVFVGNDSLKNELLLNLPVDTVTTFYHGLLFRAR
ncbi:MAG: glycosyltransferase family 39 protein [Bacteroidetes bacterium]|nr:glycosyltransferase family 39 protein [Bacteroidota bacterium]